MTDHPAAVRAIAGTATIPTWRRELITPTIIAATGVGAILAIATIDAALRGPCVSKN